MSFSKKIKEDKRVIDLSNRYMQHPFIQGLKSGNLDKKKFKKYLIQDSLYLKDYAKVYAYAFLLSESVEDLQFLHSCIGVVVSDETNMHTKYLKDFGLDVYKVDNMKIESANRDYLDYMLSFAKGGDIKQIFTAALPCTLTYEYIGKTLKKECGKNLKDNYYAPWIEAYAGLDFEKFSVDSCRLLDKICKDIDEKEEEKLIEIYLKACDHEMKFWDMSFML
ncbi:thiaminase II [Haloimpatiens sp. FM7315]|uniref:thiaminase II n=1 Tax=Haloimpatiens sp. FM7315 TaxID=3298609 RepID=UPI00370AE557